MDQFDLAPATEAPGWGLISDGCRLRRAGAGSIVLAGVAALRLETDAKFFLHIPRSSAVGTKQNTCATHYVEKPLAALPSSSSSRRERWSSTRTSEFSKSLRAGVVSLVVLCAVAGDGDKAAMRKEQKKRRLVVKKAAMAARAARVASNFWSDQERLLKTGVPQRDSKFWAKEEQELFNASQVMQGINFASYDNIPVERAIRGGGRVPEVEMRNFQELSKSFDIPEELQRTIDKCGYSVPTPVQKHSIPALLSGRDVMVCAQTGSGKTAAFLIPLIAGVMKAERAKLEEGPICPSGLIMAPTRELCQQIAHEARRLTFRTELRVCALYGGANEGPQLRRMLEGCDIAVCTPGRLNDYLNLGLISAARTRYLILDEADRMLDMGFKPQITNIVKSRGMPPPGDPAEGGRVSMMFSATFPKDVQKAAQAYMDPRYFWCAVGRVGAAASNVEQLFLDVRLKKKKTDPEPDPHVQSRLKLEKVLEALETVKQRLQGESGSDATKTIVFLNAKSRAARIAKELTDEGVDARALHGDLPQAHRDRAVKDLRDGRCSVLVATDVASRGLDLPGIDHVINYELPNTSDDYVHRIGRTGRIGNTGIATSLVTGEETALKDILQTVEEAGKEEIPKWLKPFRRKGRPQSQSQSQVGLGSLDWVLEEDQGIGKGKGSGKSGGKSRGKSRRERERSLEWYAGRGGYGKTPSRRSAQRQPF